MTALGNHLEDNDRVGVVDLAESADPMALLAARTAFNGKRGSKLILAIGSWLSYPSETPPATIVIPYSGTQMGMIARVDAGGDPAAVAAGSNAISNRALGLTKQFSDADRETLNAGGVTLGREMYGLVRTYGYRTAAGPDYNLNWTFFQESRVVMAIAHECNAAVEEYVFDTIDGLRHLFSKVENVLVGICNRYWLSGALFGASPGEGFRVDMSVNTVDTIKLGEIHAAVYVKTSKVAEWVQISIIKVPLERALAA
jgi:phage tail sheath protein FI